MLNIANILFEYLTVEELDRKNLGMTGRHCIAFSRKN